MNIRTNLTLPETRIPAVQLSKIIIKIGTYCQQRQSSAGILVSGSIRLMRYSSAFSGKEASEDSSVAHYARLLFLVSKAVT